MKPTITASQRRQRTSSLSSSTDSTVTKIGIRKISANASAIGSRVNAVTADRLPAAPVNARSSQMLGRCATTTSRQRSPGFFRNGSADSISSAPKNTTS